MAITVEAVYENGVLKPAGPLPLKEHEKVEITVRCQADLVQTTYGMLGWKGTHKELEQILAEAEEFDDTP
ncbi:MAG TPA: antitoxin family protein [Gemmataceae bacterium]|nr:antitoxin family protein [Gemmataceae bacterium]